MSRYDFIIVGAGIAGASVAAELALHGRVLLLEAEAQPGYHSTGRSAAMFALNYGGTAFRLLTRASKAFFDKPPEGFADTRLLGTGSGSLFIGRADQADELDQIASATEAVGGSLIRLRGDDIRDLCPVLRPEIIVDALYEPADRDIDVDALHQGFLRQFRTRGGTLMTNSRVESISRNGAGWTVTTRSGSFQCAKLVNAAGAWGDHIASLAGIKPVGLLPKRRTAITFDPPGDNDPALWPLCIGAAEDFYFKPDAGRILASPANEDDMPAGDVQPEELDIAICVDQLERHTTLAVRRIASKWAGLRTFTPDRGPCLGPDPENGDFVWCVGQGGYGIQSSPAVGRLCAALARGAAVPEDIGSLGLEPELYMPSRFSDD